MHFLNNKIVEAIIIPPAINPFTTFGVFEAVLLKSSPNLPKPPPNPLIPACELFVIIFPLTFPNPFKPASELFVKIFPLILPKLFKPACESIELLYAELKPLYLKLSC